MLSRLSREVDGIKMVNMASRHIRTLIPQVQYYCMHPSPLLSQYTCTRDIVSTITKLYHLIFNFAGDPCSTDSGGAAQQ